MPRKKKTEEANEENKDAVETTEKKEEFPETEIGIDVFANQEETEPSKAGKGSEKAESKETEKKGKKTKKEELAERARQLMEKVGGEIKTEEIKEKLETSRKTLIPLEDYVKAGIYIGTKVITPHMRQYVYRRRNDGIAIINTNIIDEKLKELAKLVAKYNPEDFIIVCKRETGWKAAEKFSELTGVRVFTKKYPAGILTNPKLPNFFEVEMVFICDSWLDKNALNDGKIMKKKVYALCDTNNYTLGIDFFAPCNNKSAKSLGIVFYILAREYLKARKIDKEIKLTDFISEEDWQMQFQS